MTVSPMVATRPPRTDGSTTTFRFTCLPVALARAAARRSCWSCGEGHGAAHLGQLEVLRATRRDPRACRRWRAGRDRDPSRSTMLTSWIGGAGGLAAEEVLDDGLTLGGGDLLVGQRVAQRVGLTRSCGRTGTARPRPRRWCLRRGRSRTVPVRSRRCGCRSLGCSHSCDEALDELLVGGVVERAGDHVVDGGVRQSGDLGAQLVTGTVAGGGDVGDRTRLADRPVPA